MQPAKSRKRAKTLDARTLSAQSSDAALSKTGELDVAAYVSAREFEIRALEKGMQQSKAALTSRAFQQVPRALRRRTASHNVKRVPGRLRARAKREMIEDNTPTVTARRRKPTHNLRIRLETARRLQSLNARTKAKRQAKTKAKAKHASQSDTTENEVYMTAPRIPKIKKNKLSHPPPAETKYRKRQRCKTWLPTHMFHAKRAHMTPPSEPLWRFAVPISPTEKSYRPSHRARGARGALAWDMSYMSTVLIEGSESGLEAVLRGLGVVGEEAWGRKGRKWREGTRVLQTWVFELQTEGDNMHRRPIAPVTLIQQVGARGSDGVDGDNSGNGQRKKKILIRIHPSAFLQLWSGLIDLSKRQNPPVSVEDLRFDIGSIEITGPGSTEALNSVLRPDSPTGSPAEKSTAFDSDGPEAIWRSLLRITNPSTLPQGALLAFTISDPRLHFPSQTLRPRSEDVHMKDGGQQQQEEEEVSQAKLLATWPVDRTQGPARIFNRQDRLVAARQLPSQKAINRRRALAGPGSAPDRQPTDPQIPVLLFASRPASSSSSTVSASKNGSGGGSRGNGSTNLTGSWTVLLPWKCVLPVWTTLLYYPLSSGGNPRFGGLQEHQQAAFEAGVPWFPGDFPGTAAGWEWGERERKRAWQEWSRRPKGRRVEFNRLRLRHLDNSGLGQAAEPKGNSHRKGEDIQIGEFGRGWACDWERLLQGDGNSSNEHRDETSIQEEGNQPDPKPSPEFNPLPREIYQLRTEDAILIRTKSGNTDLKDDILSSSSSSSLHGALATVRITLQGRGTPTPRSRIYRLPDEPGLREKWIRNTTSLDYRVSDCGTGSCDDNGNNNNGEQTSLTSQWTGFESGTGTSDAKSKSPVPHLLPGGDDAIIGFVTSGGYNLATGQGMGIGSIAFSKLASSKSKTRPTADFCLVRPAGEQVGRLARWTLV